MMEHRWGERFVVDWPVRLRCGIRMIGGGRLRNLSVSGGFVETDLRPSPEAPIQIEILSDGARLDFDAFVVRVGGDGIGVEWVELGPALFGLLLERSAARMVSASATRSQPRPHRSA